MYKYKPKAYLAQVGDVCQHRIYGLFVVTYITTTNDVRYLGYKLNNSYLANNCRVLATKPSTEARLGDTIICTDSDASIYCTAGIIYTIRELTNNGAFYLKENNAHICLQQRDGFVIL